jgi:hypothetical protein
MKERPIMFTTEMVQAILSGSKTQTRRIVKPAPGRQSEWLSMDTLHKKVLTMMPYEEKPGWFALRVGYQGDPTAGHIGCVWSPYGFPGDQLWVRETFALQGDQVIYKAGHQGDPIKWTSPLRMAKHNARIHLRITGIKCERLQSISVADAMDEGVFSLPLDFILSIHPEYAQKYAEWQREKETYRAAFGNWLPGKPPMPAPPLGPGPIERYKLLWEHINGVGSWDSNPWVWVVQFEQVKA